MKTYWIIGGGKFGLKAAGKINSRERGSTPVIVEKNPQICEALDNQGYEVICTEGITYLDRKLVTRNHPDWIIPAIPVHLNG
jgi:heterodisulfide reductase subunit A-like polyferredoxin